MRNIHWYVFVTCVAIAGLTSQAAQAQTVVVNPTTVIFVASPDHDAMITVGAETIPRLTRYDLRIYLDGAQTPTSVVDLGKPAKDAAGEIRATPPILIGLPLGAYRAKVAAIGPGGEMESDPSHPFVRMGPPAPPTQVRVGS